MLLAQTYFPDLEGTKKQRFGLSIAVLQEKYLTEVVDSRGYRRMIGSQRSLLSSECLEVLARSHVILVLLNIESAHAVEDLPGIQMNWPEIVLYYVVHVTR